MDECRERANVTRRYEFVVRNADFEGRLELGEQLQSGNGRKPGCVEVVVGPRRFNPSDAGHQTRHLTEFMLHHCHSPLSLKTGVFNWELLSITGELREACSLSAAAGASTPIFRAGLPATIVNGGTSLRTTAPADTTLPSPTVTPGKIMHRAPSQTLSPIVTGRTSSAGGGN